MNPIAILFGFVLLVISVLYVASPMRPSASTKAPVRAAKKALAEQQRTHDRQAVLLALRDLDFDYQAGKVAEVDYHPLRADLLRQAAALIADQERLEDDAIEAMIQSRRAVKREQAPVSNANCQQCNAQLLEGAKFCSKCGSSVEESRCPNCKNDIQPGDHFCPSCGIAVPIKTLSKRK